MQKKFITGALLGGLVSVVIVLGGVFVLGQNAGEDNTEGRRSSALVDGVDDGKLPALPGADSSQKLAKKDAQASNQALANLPEPMPEIEKRSKVDLWDKNARFSQIEVNGIPALHLRVDPQVLAEFHVGQQVDLAIPQSDNSFSSKFTSTHNQMGGVKVWKAAIKNGHPMDNLIVTQGKIETHVIVSTKQGTFSAIIDNKTGQTTLVDEGEIASRSLPIEDGIPADPISDNPPLS